MSFSNWSKQFGFLGKCRVRKQVTCRELSAESKFIVVVEAAGLSEIDLGEHLYSKQILHDDKPSLPTRNRKKEAYSANCRGSVRLQMRALKMNGIAQTLVCTASK
ncbi:hypothetical protein [Pseudomonas sp. RT6P73]